MRRKNIPHINKLVEREFADKLRENGFHPYRDSTEWVRLQNGEIVQTILFYEYHYWLEVFFHAELMTEYLWIDYRDIGQMDTVVGSNFCNVRKLYGTDVYTMNDIFGSGAENLEAKTKELGLHLDLAIAALDSVRSPSDILQLDPNEAQHPERICLYYAIGDEDMLKKAARNASPIDPSVYSEDEAPERLKRDYWRVWRIKAAFVARGLLKGKDTKALHLFSEECRKYNTRYLKRHLPELFEE